MPSLIGIGQYLLSRNDSGGQPCRGEPEPRDSRADMILQSWRSPLKRARRAARSGKWADAADAYRRHLRRHPRDAAVWVQLGHSLKEAGELPDAAAAYREATRIAPAGEDGWIHLAHLERRLGDRAAAIAALRQALAGQGCGGDGRAAQALVEMGARESLPPALQAQIETGEGHYALSRYAAWRAAQPVSGVTPVPANVLAVIDGRGASAGLVEVTRGTLGGTACLILTDGAAPPADGRWAGEEDAIRGATHLLLVEAGSRITPQAVARLYAAVADTGAGAAYGDHDHWEPAVQGITFGSPCFQPMFDPLWFARAAVRPPCLLVTAAAAGAVATWGALFAARLSLPAAYAHVPLVLASRRAGIALAETGMAAAPRDIGDTPIQVIVQTRDAPELLAACVASLWRTAARPDRLDIVIMDNRSVLPRTAGLLADWAGEGIARVIAHDEPFNWARANNLAAARGDAPLLLFLNNDVEMESDGWDMALRAGLAGGGPAEVGVGALGGLLLYPDRLIQHAGVVFGMGAQGGAVHEGVGHPLEPGGPAARWRHPRLAAAVTGAWLATSRAVFDAVGGFEERLPIAYNDVDFCLRCRAAGRLVVQASHIVAVHRESATRGSVMSSAEHARDQADWAWLRARWGAALDLDPAYNPHWLRISQPFDGLHTPSPEAISRWIAASARPRPWSVAPPA